jgi:hypothetical protein
MKFTKFWLHDPDLQSRYPDILPRDTLPKDILPKDILPNGHFAERTVYRKENLPKIKMLFRQNVLDCDPFLNSVILEFLNRHQRRSTVPGD